VSEALVALPEGVTVTVQFPEFPFLEAATVQVGGRMASTAAEQVFEPPDPEIVAVKFVVEFREQEALELLQFVPD
jgi:hypothetical protein